MPACTAAADTHIVLRVDVRAEPHELGGRGGLAAVSSPHERSPAVLRQAWRSANTMSTPARPAHGCAAHARPRGATARPAHAAAANAHIVLRIDIRVEPHELDGRGGVAPVTSAHERSLTILRQAQRSVQPGVPEFCLAPHTRRVDSNLSPHSGTYDTHCPSARATTHNVLRVDVRAEPHELGDCAVVTSASSVHQHRPTILQHAHCGQPALRSVDAVSQHITRKRTAHTPIRTRLHSVAQPHSYNEHALRPLR